MEEDASEASTLTIGERGESVAEAYLREQGWSIRATNYETQRGEIDLVAETTEPLGDRTVEMIVFVEVKARSRSGAILPESAVTADKRHTLTYMANRYLSEHAESDVSARFDVITVVFEGDTPDIHHYSSAFDASGRIN